MIRNSSLYFRKLWPIIHEMDSKGNGPTQFEILTAMAFSYFSKKEVGFGFDGNRFGRQA